MSALKSTNWDALTASAPLDKRAAIARDGKGVSFDLPEKATQNAFDAPAKLKPYDDIPENNLTGQRFQKLVILGMCDRPRERGGAHWSCRCDCGRYCVYTASSLKKHRAEGRAMCSECDYVEEVKAGRHPTAEQIAARRAEKETERQRRSSVALLTHPKLRELRSNFAALGVSEREFMRALGDFIQVEHRAAKQEAVKA